MFTAGLSDDNYLSGQE